MSKLKVNIWRIGPLACIISGLICWILHFAMPNFQIGYDVGFPAWIVTFMIGPIGLAFSFVSLKKGYPHAFMLVIGNLMMVLSIWIVSLVEFILLLVFKFPL
jgi:hypothetical protein